MHFENENNYAPMAPGQVGAHAMRQNNFSQLNANSTHDTDFSQKVSLNQRRNSQNTQVTHDKPGSVQTAYLPASSTRTDQDSKPSTTINSYQGQTQDMAPQNNQKQQMDQLRPHNPSQLDLQQMLQSQGLNRHDQSQQQLGYSNLVSTAAGKNPNGFHHQNGMTSNHQVSQEGTQLSLKVSDSTTSNFGFANDKGQQQPKQLHANNIKIEASNSVSIYQCQHHQSLQSAGAADPHLQIQKNKTLIGDAHLVNCNECGAYFPKSGSTAIRSLKRHAQQNKLYVSDILRSMYAQCQQKPNNPVFNVKVSNQYQEVRNLIIDWLAEVSETLHLDIQKSAYHAIIILDRFLSNNLKKTKKDMDQGVIMLQALCCLFIAAKNLEKDPNVPSSRKFLRQLPGYKPTQSESNNEQMAYKCGLTALQGGQMDNQRFNSRKNELVAQETTILNEISFDLDSYPSFFDIVEIFMSQGILYSSDQHCNGPIKDEQCTKLIEKYIDYFVLLSLQDHKLVNTNQYLIACAIVSASRKISNISPAWSIELEQLTGLQHSHFCNIEKRLLVKSDQQKQKYSKPLPEPKKAEVQQPKSSRMEPVTHSNLNQSGYKNNLAELNGSAILLANMKDQHNKNLRQQNTQPQDTQEEIKAIKQKDKHERDVSKSNLLGRHQDSSLFRNMVNNNKLKYDERLKQDQATQGADGVSKQDEIRIKYGSQRNKAQYYSSRLQQQPMDPSNLQASQSSAPFSNDQPQSLKHVGNPKFKNEIERNNSQSSVLSTHSQSSNSKIIRKKHQELYNGNQQQTGQIQRQKSLVIQNNIVSNSLTGQNNDENNLNEAAKRQIGNHQSSGVPGQIVTASEKMVGRANHGSLGPQPASTRASDRPRTNGLLPSNPPRNLPPGTGTKVNSKQQQLYSRELSNAKFQINQKGAHPRNSSQSSNNSVSSAFQAHNKLTQNKVAGNPSLMNSENKSLVRQALKNQKRNHKIAQDQDNSSVRMPGTGTQFGRSHCGSTSGSQNPVNRNQAGSQRGVRASNQSNSKTNRVPSSSNGDAYEPTMNSSKGMTGHQKSNAPKIANQKLSVNRSLSQSGQKIVQNIPTNSQLIKNKMKAKNLRDTSHTSQNSNGSTGPGQQSFLKNQLSNHPNIRGNYQQMLPPQFQQSSSLHLRFGSQGNNQILNTTGNESTDHQKMN